MSTDSSTTTSETKTTTQQAAAPAAKPAATAAATTVTQQAVAKPAVVQAAASDGAKVAPAALKPVEDKFAKDSTLAGFRRAMVRVIKPDTLQYDPEYPRVKVTTSAAEGELIPLTPFFERRIGTTIELVRLIESEVAEEKSE